MNEILQLQDVVDLEAYPLNEPGNPIRAEMIEQWRNALDASLYVSIPNFVRPEALTVMADEAKRLRTLAYDNNEQRNVYLHRNPDDSLPNDHPRNLFDAGSVRMIAYDLIPDQSPLKLFYHSSAVRDTISEIVNEGPLYDNEDPYQPANYVCYENGDQSSWHFDAANSFTVTLMVQAADAGGQFQMSPNTRSDTDQNYDHVAKVLRGERNDTLVDVAREAGELCIFRGCNSLHRVSPVSGDTMRIMGVFVYERQPGIVGDPKINRTIYGERVIVAE